MPAKKAAKKATAKKSAKKAAKKTTSKKTSAKKTGVVKKTAPAKKAAIREARKPSVDEIAELAYLNYLHRANNGLPGDAHHDWIEAERNLSVK